MAERSGLSKSTTSGRDLAGVGTAAGRTQSFKFSTDPLLVAKVLDVIGLYHNPPDKAVVLCVDELCEASHNSSDVKSSVM